MPKSAPSKRAEFHKNGILKLDNSIDSQQVIEIRDQIWQAIEDKFGIQADKPSTWFMNTNNPSGDNRAKRLNGMGSIMRDLKATATMDKVEHALQSTIDHIFGQGAWQPLDQWYSLFSFPGTDKDWNIPHKSWHNDEPIVVGDNLPWSLFVFVFLDTVTIETGPTTIISGSHKRAERLAKELASSHHEALIQSFNSVNSGLFEQPSEVRLLPMDQVLKPLTKQDPWLKELLQDNLSQSRFQELIEQGSTVDGIEHKVVTLTGAVGDIIIMDPRCLHTFSANVSKSARQVLRLDFRRKTNK